MVTFSVYDLRFISIFTPGVMQWLATLSVASYVAHSQGEIIIVQNSESTASYTRSELPKEIRVNPNGCEIKPSGAGRVTADLSAPHLKDPEVSSTSVPCSVNASIDLSQYPTKMIQTQHVLRRLNRVGPNTMMCKIDWADGI